MSGLADARIEAALLRRLASSPADVVALAEAARQAAPGPLRGREGALHAILRRLVRAGRLVVLGHAPSGGALYAVAAPAGPSREAEPEVAAPIPPAASRADSRAALAVARAVADPQERGRVVGDVLAHRAALGAGASRAFGSVKAARLLLRRADRGQPLLAVAENPWEGVKRWVLHEGASVVATVLALALLWLFVGEFRVVPSNSMQPTLRPGDRVVVRKLFGQEMPRRFDVVVFRKPSDGVVLVKRAVGLGGERLSIEHGDVLVDGVILRKPPALQAALRQPLLRQRFVAGQPADGWQTPPAGTSFRRLAKPLFADEPTFGREVHLPPRPLVHDLYLEALVGETGALWIEWVREDGAPANPVAAVGWMRAPHGPHREAIGVRPGEFPGPGTGVAPLAVGEAPPGSQPTRVTLAFVDGWLHLTAPTWRFEAPVPEVRQGRARVVVEGEVSEVALDRDVHYTNHGVYATDPATPYVVPAGHVFCLGDNSAHSGDSRLREVGPIPLDRLLGPVVFRVWPPWRVGRPR